MFSVSVLHKGTVSFRDYMLSVMMDEDGVLVE